MFRIAYCLPYDPSKQINYERMCQELVDAAESVSPSLLNKVKFHLILHLPQSMKAFGPTCAYNTERYRTFSCISNQLIVHVNGPFCIDVNALMD